MITASNRSHLRSFGIAARTRLCTCIESSPRSFQRAGASTLPFCYEGHVPTSNFQKLLIAAYAADTSLKNPERGDMIAALGETTGILALRRLRDHMMACPNGREIIAKRPNINEQGVSPARLRQLPEHSFGREYIRFMDHHGYSPDQRSTVRFVDDPELAFVMKRFRQVHDFWHVLCGLPPTVLGELALKWFEMVQTGLPIAALSSVFGPLALKREDRTLLRQYYIPWALQSAREARPLMSVWYERSFDKPLKQLREDLMILPAPVIER